MTNETKKPEARMLTSRQVAEQLNVTEWCLRNWRHLGTKGPKFLKIEGGSIRYRQSDVDAWLSKQQRAPVASK